MLFMLIEKYLTFQKRTFDGKLFSITDAFSIRY